jgi:hypothetical protein
MRLVAWFQVVVGVAVVVLWAVLLTTGQVPEVADGRVDIWFHVAAELAMAGLLVGAGAALLRRVPRAGLLSALALGWLGYSAVNSPGYYAQTGDWAVVGMFGLVLAATTGAFAVLWRQAPRPAAPPSDVEPTPPRLTTTATRGRR